MNYGQSCTWCQETGFGCYDQVTVDNKGLKDCSVSERVLSLSKCPDSGYLSGPAIIGIAVGVISFFIVITVITIICIFRKKKQLQKAIIALRVQTAQASTQVDDDHVTSSPDDDIPLPPVLANPLVANPVQPAVVVQQQGYAVHVNYDEYQKALSDNNVNVTNQPT